MLTVDPVFITRRRFLALCGVNVLLSACSTLVNDKNNKFTIDRPEYTAPILDLGGIQIWNLTEIEHPVAYLSEFIPDLNNSEFDLYKQWLYPHFITSDKRIIISEGGYLIKAGDQLVIFDTGARINSPDSVEPVLLQALHATGYTVEDIDMVICSHLHFDHIGSNTTLKAGKLLPTFPNARYKIPRLDWEFVHWGDSVPDYFGSVNKRIVPLIDSNQLDFVEGDEKLTDSMILEPWHGHTPGHMGLRVIGTSKQAVFCGDLLHHPAQVFYQEVDVFSSDRQAAIESRRRFIKRYTDSGIVIIPTHCPKPYFGTLVSTTSGIQFSTSG